MSRFSCLVTFLLSVSAAVPAFAYDASWYKANGWSGEYPYGFTMLKDVTVQIRENLDPTASKTISCQLKKGATYHEWNTKRVKSDELKFVSFTKIATYEVKSSFSTNVTRDPDGRKVTINFKKGDRWFFLVYLAEGIFRFRFNHTIYNGDQDLFEKSIQISSTKNDRRTYEEWLKLKCANGAAGWIFVKEIKNDPGFSEADASEYGKASDQFKPVRRSAGIPSTENMVAPSAPKLPSPATIAPDPLQSSQSPSAEFSIAIPMKREGGTYVVPVLINNAITLDFVVDSGAADVSIPADVVLTLIRTGTLGNTAFIGERTYRLADGSTTTSNTFRLQSLRVGGKIVEGVIGSIAPVQGGLLLGQSFLSRFKSWSIDNGTHSLLLTE